MARLVFLDTPIDYSAIKDSTHRRVLTLRELQNELDAMADRHLDELCVCWQIAPPSTFRPLAWRHDTYEWQYWGPHDELYWHFWGFGRAGHPRCQSSQLADKHGAKGNGAVALKEICAFADEHRLPLSLDAANSELVRYYERFGFIDTQTTKYQPFCVRFPRIAQATEIAA